MLRMPMSAHPSAGAARYFVAPHNTKVGPLTEQAVTEKIRSGEYSAELLGWREGTADWVPLSQLFPQSFVAIPSAVASAGFAVDPTAVLGRRVGALLIDGLILSAINAVLIPADMVVPVALHLLVTCLYSMLFLASSKQATPGMMICKIRVIMESGAPVNATTALVRTLLSFVSGSLLFTLGYWWAFWDGKHQTLHDKVAGTLVIKG
jgi:uncharacterized RDD family membrane protein YckC